MSNLFQAAQKLQSYLRLALAGPSGSGKSFTGLRFATALAALRQSAGQGNGRVAAVDTESGSLSKYVGEPNPDGGKFVIDVIPSTYWRDGGYTVEKLIEAIKNAQDNGYRVMLIDSLSHFWFAEGGLLDRVDKTAKRSNSSNTYFAWKEATPLHNKLVTTILGAEMDIIVSMRTKTEYVVEQVNGKSVPKKVGMAPIQRDGLEYEFDIVCDVSPEHNLIVGKTRCSAITDGVYETAGEPFIRKVWAWLTEGDAAIAAPKFELEASRKAKLLSLGATEEEIAALKSIEEARALFNSFKE
jgi:hypothetical protein